MRSHCTRIVRKALAAVRPQFRLDLAGGIHGLPHWSRVWLHGRAIAEALDLDPAVLAWFAFLHDSQRVHDGRDPLHGQRAADFAMKLRREGVIDDLDPRSFELLCEAMRLHSRGYTIAEPLVQACWDADRLDLARVGTSPHPNRLCTPYARQAHVIDLAVQRSTALRPPGPPGSDRTPRGHPGVAGQYESSLP